MIERMFEAIELKHFTLMDDILNRYSGETDHIQDKFGNSLVALAAQKADHNMVGLLLSRGFDPNTVNQEGNTPLHLAMI